MSDVVPKKPQPPATHSALSGLGVLSSEGHTPSPASAAGAVSAVQPEKKRQLSDSDCPYLAEEWALCNKCGRVHNGQGRAAYPTPAVPVEAKQEPTCRGLTDSRCDYLAHCGRVCNRCGRVHNGLASPTAGTPAPAVPTGLRMLTLPELADLLAAAGGDPDAEGEWHLDYSEALQRKFCEVNGIAFESAAPAAPAVQGLTLERIDEIADSDECNPDDRGWGPKFSYRAFARAIEREVRSTSPSVQVPSAGTPEAVSGRIEP